jgi:hypothetical protein
MSEKTRVYAQKPRLKMPFKNSISASIKTRLILFSIYLCVSLEWAEKVPNEIGAIALKQDGISAASHDGVAQL